MLRLRDVAGLLMFDGMCFLAMSACFFVFSRSLSPSHWKRFYGYLLGLLVVDSIWISVCMYRGIPLKPWLVLNALLAVVIIIVLMSWRRRVVQNALVLVSPTVVIAVSTLITTLLDYYTMRDFYFPNATMGDWY